MSETAAKAGEGASSGADEQSPENQAVAIFRALVRAMPGALPSDIELTAAQRAALGRLPQVLEAQAAHGRLTPWMKPGKWITARLFDTQDALDGLWRNPPPGVSHEQRHELLKIRRILKAICVARARGDDGAMGQLNRVASKILDDSLRGKLIGREEECKNLHGRRPGCAMVTREDGTDGVLPYGNVPDDHAAPWEQPWHGLVVRQEGSRLNEDAIKDGKVDLVVGANISEGRGAMVESLARHLHLRFELQPQQQFVDELVGRGFRPGAAEWYSVKSVMLEAALTVHDAAVAKRDAALFSCRPNAAFELTDADRALLREEIEDWLSDVRARDQPPALRDFERLVRLGFKALGANPQVVNNLFKGSLEKEWRARQGDALVEGSDQVVTGS